MAEVFTGAKAAVYANGEPVFFVGSITVDIENRLEEIPQLDSVLVAEYAENGHRCSFVINSFKLAKNNDRDIENTAAFLGFEPKEGKPMRDLTILEEMIFQVINLDTGIKEFEMIGCKFNGGSGSVDARGVWTGSWKFKAREGRGL